MKSIGGFEIAMAMKLIFNEPSALKSAPLQSSELTMLGYNYQVLNQGKGDEFELLFEPFKIDGLPGEADDHYLVVLKNNPRPEAPQKRWVVYAGHVRFEGTHDENDPQDEGYRKPLPTGLQKLAVIKEIPIIKWGKLIDHDIPGLKNRVRMNQPLHTTKIPNFTWGEATHGGTRIPVDESVTKGILRIGAAMQEVRGLLGDRPIRVNSWYRDPMTNKRVGGARFSRHLRGDAVDFVVKGVSPKDVYRELDTWWGPRGGLASSSVFTHIDARGYKARWSYGY